MGNSVEQALGHDPNHLQLSSRVATKIGGPVGGLMNLTYDYQAWAGQTGTGSTAILD